MSTAAATTATFATTIATKMQTSEFVRCPTPPKTAGR